MWHILTNLLSNAIKYSPEQDNISLKLSYGDRHKEVIIEVSDRGIGIPPACQKHLFESFYRAENVGSIPGSGLGLSIVKKAVDLHQGKIDLESKLNQGTTIRVTLPVSINSAVRK